LQLLETGLAIAEAAKAAVTKRATLENIVNEMIDEVGCFSTEELEV